MAEQDFLVVQENLPAGTTLIEGSVRTSASSFELADGVLTLYFPPGVNPGTTTYDVFGYVPGKLSSPAGFGAERLRARPLPPRPGRRAASVRSPGEPDTDPYKPTPDELYARGKAQFDAGRFAEAGEALEPLYRWLYPPRRHRQGRLPDAPLDQHPRGPAAQDRPVSSRWSRRSRRSCSSASTS